MFMHSAIIHGQKVAISGQVRRLKSLSPQRSNDCMPLGMHARASDCVQQALAYMSVRVFGLTWLAASLSFCRHELHESSSSLSGPGESSWSLFVSDLHIHLACVCT